MSKYIWESSYQASLIATDPLLLQLHIQKTREVMSKRMKTLAIREYPAAMQEYDAIQNAESQLKVLEREIAKKRPSSSARDALPRTQTRDIPG